MQEIHKKTDLDPQEEMTPLHKNIYQSTMHARNLKHSMIELVAHRGASLDAPENTMPAFILAVEQGARSIECDIMLTKDLVPIIFHDHELDRTTNSSGKVALKKWHELAKLDAGSWFDAKFENTTITQLATLLQWQKKASIDLHLEIKTRPQNTLDRDLDIIMDLVHQFADNSKIRILSFQLATLKRLCDLKTTLPCVLSTTKFQPQIIENAKQTNCQQINIDHRYVQESIIEKITQHKIKTGVYTVNCSEKIKKMKAMHISTVYTDDHRLYHHSPIS